MPGFRNLRPIVLTAALLAVAALAAAAGLGHGKLAANRLPEAKAYTVCAAAGPFWPTQTLAIERSTAWIACKERSRVERFDLARGRRLGTVAVDAPVIAVASGLGAVWALDVDGTLYRIDPRTARIVKRIATGAGTPYNIWIGAGSVWIVDDEVGRVNRISRAGRVLARIAVGDGPSDMVFDGPTAWVVNHRDRGLVRIDARTNAAKRLATLSDADAPERIALLSGSLWITGRGTDLLQVRPTDGAVANVIDIGAGGIDVIAASGALWVPSRNAQVDSRGFPTMETLRRVTVGGAIATVATATGRVDVHGLAVGPNGAGVWFADNTTGRLYRISSRG